MAPEQDLEKDTPKKLWSNVRNDKPKELWSNIRIGTKLSIKDNLS